MYPTAIAMLDMERAIIGRFTAVLEKNTMCLSRFLKKSISKLSEVLIVTGLVRSSQRIKEAYLFIIVEIR